MALSHLTSGEKGDARLAQEINQRRLSTVMRWMAHIKVGTQDYARSGTELFWRVCDTSRIVQKPELTELDLLNNVELLESCLQVIIRQILPGKARSALVEHFTQMQSSVEERIQSFCASEDASFDINNLDVECHGHSLLILDNILAHELALHV